MARKPRIHYYGAIYHVIARGNNKENIFLTKYDKLKYLELIKRYKNKFGFNLYAYVLMENHIHLLIQVEDNPLSKIMQGLQLSYTQYFNKRHNHVGHVFQQRYKAMLCNNDEYLLTLVKYIHFNPKKSGIYDSLDYEWSSHKEYKMAKNALVATNFILEMFDVNHKIAVKRYLHFMEDMQEEDLSPTDSYQPLDMVDEANLATLEQNIKSSVQDVLLFVAKRFGISGDLILTKTKKPNVVEARRLFLHLIINNGLLSRTEAAKYVGLSQSTVTKAFNDILFNDQFQKLLLKLQDEFKKEQSKA